MTTSGGGPSPSFFRNLYALQQQDKFTDVTIQVDSREFRAHRHILAAASAYFMAMFTTSDAMREAHSPRIHISGVDADGFDLLLRYCYLGQLDLDTSNVALILTTAVYLQIDHVVERCIMFLTANIGADNCADIFSIADLYALSELKSATCEYVAKHLLLGDKRTVMTLAPEMIEHCVRIDVPIQGSELSLLGVLIEWFLHGSHREVLRKEEFTEKILQHVHFSQIPVDDLQSLISQYFLSKKTTRAQKVKTYLLEACAARQSQTAPAERMLRGMRAAILRVGGFGAHGCSADVTYSQIADRHWHPLTTLPMEVDCNYGAAVLDNQLYVIGGCFDDYQQEVVHPNCFRYNPCADRWERIAAMLTDRCRFTLTTMNDRLYAVAGVTTLGDCTGTVECYNSTADRWEFVNPLPQYRQRHAAAADPKQHVLFISGGLQHGVVLASMCAYDERNDKWRTCAPLLAPRADHAMFVHNGDVYVVGGWSYRAEMLNDDEGDAQEEQIKADTIDAYCIAGDSWRHVTTVPQARYHGGVAVHGSKVYLIGGYYRCNDFRKHTAVDCYDLETDTWTTNVKDEQDFWEHTNVVLHVPRVRSSGRHLELLQY